MPLRTGDDRSEIAEMQSDIHMIDESPEPEHHKSCYEMWR